MASSGAALILVLVLKNQEGRLQILVSPDLRTIVRGDDLAFLESLLQDFTERAKLHPEALFKHLSNLGVGPLTTHVAGPNLSEYRSIQDLSSKFVQLESL